MREDQTTKLTIRIQKRHPCSAFRMQLRTNQKPPFAPTQRNHLSPLTNSACALAHRRANYILPVIYRALRHFNWRWQDSLLLIAAAENVARSIFRKAAERRVGASRGRGDCTWPCKHGVLLSCYFSKQLWAALECLSAEVCLWEGA